MNMPTEVDLHPILVALLWAAIVLLVLRALGRISLARSCLAYLTGFIIVVGFPWFCCLRYRAGGLSELSPTGIKLMWSELVIIATCSLFYAYRGWPKSVVWCALMRMPVSS